MIRVMGVTGTRQGANSEQLRTFRSILTLIRPLDFHHGDCIGADVQCAALARDLCGASIIGHPPSDPKNRAFFDNDFTYDTKPYLTRDMDIVSESDLMIALPQQNLEVIRSGTWATVRMARSLEKPLLIIKPSGSTREERFETVKTLYDI